MNKKQSFLALVLIMLLLSPVTASGWSWGKRNPAISLIGFNSSIEPEQGYGSIVVAAYTSGWGYRSLLPSNITSEKGILIGEGDNLQYTRGSLQGGDGSGVVYENADPNQGTLEFWVRPNWANTDSSNHYIFDGSTVTLYFDASNDSWTAVVNGATITAADTFSAGDWIYILLTWDANANTLDITVDATAETQVTTAQTVAAPSSALYFGQTSASANIFNGTIAGRITNKIESSNYNSGAGSTDTFTVTPDTVWMGMYSDSDTDAVFWHRGQQVTAITDGATESTLTTGQAVGNRSWANNDRVAVWDGTGYKKEGLIDGTPSGSSILVDDGAGALVSGLSNVGVHAYLDGNSQYFYATDANFPESGLTGAQDLSIQAWIKPDTPTADAQIIVAKGNDTGNKQMYQFWLHQSNLYIAVSSDGIAWTQRASTNASFTVGKWSHVAVVYDASEGSAVFYQNGYALTDNGIALATSIVDQDPNFTIGTRAGGSFYFDGGIAHVALFDDIRTEAEILTSATNPGEDLSGAGNIIGQWYFWEASGASAIDNTQGDAGRDLTPYDGGDVTYGNCGRTQTAFISKNLIADSGMENGGIGGWTAGDAASTLNRDTTTVKFDTRSLKITNGDASQAFVRQTITTVDGEDYWFHGWCYAPTTPNGASRLVDVDTTAALGITVTQAGLSAGWNEIEFTFEATDTSTTIDLGSGSITNAEIGYWDSVELLPNIVDNGGIEVTGSEILDETDFATHAEWDVTGVADDTGGNVDFTFAGGTLNGTVQQIAADRVSTGTNSALYEFAYTVAVTTAPDGDFALTLDNFPDASTALDFTAGTHTMHFWSAADATSQPFTITATETTSTVGSFTIDDVTCKEIEGWSKTGTPTTVECCVSTAADHSGVLGIRLTGANDGEGITRDVTVVSGKRYTFSAFAKNNIQDTEILLSGATTKTIDTTNSNAWTVYRHSFEASSTTLTIQLVSGAANQDGYFDDIAVIRLDRNSPSTSTPASDINSFRIGKYSDNDGAFEVKGGATLEYPAADNLDHDEGSLSLKIHPNGWHGGDSVKHKIFSLQGHPDELIIVDKTAANNLEYYYMGDNGVPKLLRYAVDSTKLPINDWSEIYITWEKANPPNTAIYLNNTSVGSLVSSPGYYGDWHEGVNQADAYFDDIFVFEKALNASDRIRIYRLLHRASWNELVRRFLWW